MGYLGYKSLFKLSKLTNKIEIKRSATVKICSRYIKGCL